MRPLDLTREIVQRAGDDNTIWLVYSPGTQTVQTKCGVIADALSVIRPRHERRRAEPVLLRAPGPVPVPPAPELTRLRATQAAIGGRGLELGGEATGASDGPPVHVLHEDVGELAVAADAQQPVDAGRRSRASAGRLRSRCGTPGTRAAGARRGTRGSRGARSGRSRRAPRCTARRARASSIVQCSSPISAPMSAVMSVLPSGASHGIDCGVSVSRKNGNCGSRGPGHRVREQVAARAGGGSRRPSAGTGTSRNGSSASVPSTSRGSTLIGAVLMTAAAGTWRPATRTPTARPSLTVMRSTGLLQPDRVGDVAGQLLAHGGDAVLGVDVPDVRALGCLPAVADGDRAVGEAGRRARARPSRRCRPGSCRRPPATARRPARPTTPRRAAARSRRRARRRTRAGTSRPRMTGGARWRVVRSSIAERTKRGTRSRPAG